MNRAWDEKIILCLNLVLLFTHLHSLILLIVGDNVTFSLLSSKRISLNFHNSRLQPVFVSVHDLFGSSSHCPRLRGLANMFHARNEPSQHVAGKHSQALVLADVRIRSKSGGPERRESERSRTRPDGNL